MHIDLYPLSLKILRSNAWHVRLLRM